MIITISDMWKNQQKMLDNDNQIKLSSLIVILVPGPRRAGNLSRKPRLPLTVVPPRAVAWRSYREREESTLSKDQKC